MASGQDDSATAEWVAQYVRYMPDGDQVADVLGEDLAGGQFDGVRTAVLVMLLQGQVILLENLRAAGLLLDAEAAQNTGA